MFQNGELPPTEHIDQDEIIRIRSALRNLVDGPGWAYLKSRLVEKANEMIERWTKGGLSAEEGARLGAKVEMIGEVIALPENDLREYTFDEREGDVADDGGNSFSCPVENLDDLGR